MKITTKPMQIRERVCIFYVHESIELLLCSCWDISSAILQQAVLTFGLWKLVASTALRRPLPLHLESPDSCFVGYFSRLRKRSSSSRPALFRFFLMLSSPIFTKSHPCGLGDLSSLVSTALSPFTLDILC